MGESVHGAGLRESNINTAHHASAEEAKQAVLELNALEFNSDKDMKDKRIFGRTPDGIGKCFNNSSRSQHCAGGAYQSHQSPSYEPLLRSVTEQYRLTSVF